MLGGLLTSLNELSEAWSSYLEGEAGAGRDGNTGSERGDVDQIVAFFEREYYGHEERFSRFLGTTGDAEAFETQRIAYFNLTSCIDHQNEQICYLLEELRAKRAEFKQLLLDAPSTRRLGRLTAAAVMEVQSALATKALTQSIEVLKMDITDRKNTRFFKERERQDAAGPLSKLISEIKLREFASRLDSDEPGGHAPPAAERLSAQGIGQAKKDEDRGERDVAHDHAGGAVTLGEGFVSGGMFLHLGARPCAVYLMCARACVRVGSMRRRKRLTDDEINAALREKLF
jgi:hypothetical protein